MRALWIEDHQLIGDSLEMLLQVLIPEISLDKARTLDEAVQFVQTFRYEVVLMDWWLGSHDGEHTISALRAVQCLTPFIVVTADEREAVMRQALSLNVAAYVTKTSDPMALVSAIRQAVEGRRTPMPQANSLQPGVHAPPLPTLSLEAVFPELTPRQADVFRGLMKGLSDKHIARELSISETTVKTHVRAILQLVGATRRGEAVYHARSRGAGEH